MHSVGLIRPSPYKRNCGVRLCLCAQFARESTLAVHPGKTQDRGASRPLEDDIRLVEAKLRTALRDRVGAARFDLWFGEAVRLGISRDGESLEVCVPDAFFREWIQSHYSHELVEVAETVLGRAILLSIRIHDEAEPLPAELVAPPLAYSKSSAKPNCPDGVTITPPDTQNVSSTFPAVPLGVPGTTNATRSFPRQPSNPPVPPRRSLVAPNATILSSSGSSTRIIRRLEDFVTGAGNRLAHAASTEMAQSAGRTFNPLVIYGAIGLGKTHLLEGVAHALRQSHPNLHVAQFTAETFTNSFLDAMRTGSLTGFRSRYRNAGGLIVDDVHFLAAKKATQDEFLHTFNAIFDKGAPIVLAADQHPRLITRLTDELVTRFLGGMVVKIELPDLATRRAILEARARARGMDVPEAVLIYIAEHLRSSIRELEGALNTVLAQAILTGKQLDLSAAKTALRDTIRHTTRSVQLRDIEQAVCQLFGVSADALKSDNRARALAYPRMMAMYLARKHIGASYSEIGQFFGGRNHSTVISAEKKVESWLRAEERTGLLPGFETVGDLVSDLERMLGT
jgi:chromosomal replication initiator protein